MKIISLAIRDFALPVPRTGSIESHSGYGRAAADGLEIHLRVQEDRLKSHPSYRAEVELNHSFDRAEFRFQIGGRADGIFENKTPKIEEIKSAFNLPDLSKKLTRATNEHPYCLQLKTYGYFYWLEHKVVPKLVFLLVSSRTFTQEEIEISLDVSDYECWLERRLGELVEEARKCERRTVRRKKAAASFIFPFENPRPGQVELISTIDSALKDKQRLLVQAPTGLGKTAGVLYPVMKEALARGQKVIYVTPKNSQHSVAEDAVERFQDTGAKVKSLTLTAKSKICFKNEPLCNPECCEYAKDHYTKVHRAGLPDILARKRKLTAKTFESLGELYNVCPFELQFEAAQEVEAVICDYNYVFAPRVAIGKMSGPPIGLEGKPNLVIDEAHNLLARAMDYYSPSLSTLTLEKMRPEVRELPSRFRADAEQLLEGCLETVNACRPAGAARATKIDPPAELFLMQDSELRTFLSRYLDSDIEIPARDIVLRLCFYWSEFTAALGFVTEGERQEFFTTFQPHGPSGGSVKITCCDASQMLRDCYDEYEQVVGFSATLKPFDYYAKLSGLDPETTKLAEFQSPFPKARRKLLIIPQISTKYSDRERNYQKIAEAIGRIVSLRPGNYFAFFPSFDFLTRVAALFQTPDGFTAIRQERQMRAGDIQEILEHLKNKVAPTVMFAVQGGVFSEGVDYPGEMIIGAFVIGPPLPSFDLEREEMREYYQKNYGSGFDYAYTFPAMAKAVQSAGRVIRSETDRGLIVLMDNRFIQASYTQSMPQDWFEKSAKELVSQSILTDIQNFWNETR